jgi:hypothetical protein
MKPSTWHVAPSLGHARGFGFRGAAIALLLLLLMCPAARAADGWQAGVARAKITPRESTWMSGYGGRDHPSEGTLHDLWAKALVLRDVAGNRAVMVTLDLVGIDRQLALDVRAQLRGSYQLSDAEVTFCTSHTHTGPVVGGNLAAMYALDEQQQRRVDDYAAELRQTLVKLVGDALEDLQPARITWGNGHASFGVNRRNNREAEVPKLRDARRLVGPVDHDVPVLAVEGPAGQLKAIVFGYACHATVLSFYQWSGDYPGFAQIHLEKAHPEALALFFAGCGADVNPLPRRTVELADGYGRRLAEAVDRVLNAPMHVLAEDAKLGTVYEEIDLPLDTLPTREQIEKEASSNDRFVAGRANRLLAQIDGGTPLSQTYPYPVQAWRLGDQLLLITLGGEVVVDFSRRLKAELGAETTWVAGYANDVMAYIPSRRVLTEGGYEGGGAMVYYGLPTVWAPQVEQLIIRKAHDLARKTSGTTPRE